MTNTTSDFWTRVSSPDAKGCQIWEGGRYPTGYGRFFLRGKQLYAHRFAYELAYGPLEVGLYVCHRCDNPPCVNPEHLFAGSPRDNTQDAIKKGRRIAQIRAQRLRSKLTPEQVHRIRYSGEPAVALKRELGISFNAVRHIRDRKYWRDVP